MLTFVRTHEAMPGKLFETIALGKELAAIVKQSTGLDWTLAVAVGGNGAEIARIGRADDLASYEKIMSANMGDPKYRAVAERFAGLLVPGTLRDQIWRHI